MTPNVFTKTLSVIKVQTPSNLDHYKHAFLFSLQDMSGGPYPVMVWLHGGGNVMGANIQYPGHFFADKDVVIVVPNYRLDIFGMIHI